MPIARTTPIVIFMSRRNLLARFMAIFFKSFFGCCCWFPFVPFCEFRDCLVCSIHLFFWPYRGPIRLVGRLWFRFFYLFLLDCWLGGGGAVGSRVLYHTPNIRWLHRFLFFCLLFVSGDEISTVSATRTSTPRTQPKSVRWRSRVRLWLPYLTRNRFRFFLSFFFFIIPFQNRWTFFRHFSPIGKHTQY